MRSCLFLLALGAISVPAAAQPVARPPRAAPALPPQLTDPATADQIANMMQSLSRAFLDLPVGELEAAAQGRPATAADKRVTIRDRARRDDPEFDAKFAAQMARTRPMVQQSMKALNEALPAIVDSFRRAGEAIERAAANMPDPTYPRR